MRRVAAASVVVLLLGAWPSWAGVQPGASAQSCAPSSAALDIVGGEGSIDRHSLLDLPNGTHLDLDGTLTFTVSLGGTSCRSAEYGLDVYGTSPLGLLGAPLQLLGSERTAGNGQPSITFTVSYRDFAAVRDPVDVDGGDRCVHVVGTVVSHNVVRDRAPDVGTFTVCPGDVAISQPPFE